MIKFLILSFIFFYILFKGVSFLFKMLFHAPGSHPFSGQFGQKNQRKANTPPNSNVNVDYVPNEEKNKRRKAASRYFDDGEYVDYEEVK